TRLCTSHHQRAVRRTTSTINAGAPHLIQDRDVTPPPTSQSGPSQGFLQAAQNDWPTLPLSSIVPPPLVEPHGNRAREQRSASPHLRDYLPPGCGQDDLDGKAPPHRGSHPA